VQNPNKNIPDFSDEDLDNLEDYDDYGEAQYGHGRISDMADDYDPNVAMRYGKIIEEKEQYAKEWEEKNIQNLGEEYRALLDCISESDDLDESLRESAKEYLRDLNRKEFDDGKYYFSYVQPKVEKGFKIATEELRKIAHKNHGYILTNTELKQLVWRDARIEMIANGIHIENEGLFKALLLKLFSHIVFIPRTDGKVNIMFVYHNYYDVKELGE